MGHLPWPVQHSVLGIAGPEDVASPSPEQDMDRTVATFTHAFLACISGHNLSLNHHQILAEAENLWFTQGLQRCSVFEFSWIPKK